MRDRAAFRIRGDYDAPEMEVDTSRETSGYTNSIDIWALGCITHEILTLALPLQGRVELSSYCSNPKLPRNTMALKNISKGGIEFVERALAYPPEYRITAREALGLEWLRPEGKGLGAMEDGTGLAFDNEGRLRMGIPTPPLYSPPSFITHNPPKVQPPIVPTTLWGPPVSVDPLLTWCIVAVRPVTAVLTFKSPYDNAIGRTISTILQWVCTLCEALVVSRYFLAVTIFVLWSLFFWGLVSPLLTAIGIQGLPLKLILFATSTYWAGRGIYILAQFWYYIDEGGFGGAMRAPWPARKEELPGQGQGIQGADLAIPTSEIANAVARYFLAVTIFVLWSLFFWGLVSPLLTAIGIQGLPLKLTLFAINTYQTGRGIYILTQF